jgi:hypothetical protein
VSVLWVAVVVAVVAVGVDAVLFPFRGFHVRRPFTKISERDAVLCREEPRHVMGTYARRTLLFCERHRDTNFISSTTTEFHHSLPSHPYGPTALKRKTTPIPSSVCLRKQSSVAPEESMAPDVHPDWRIGLQHRAGRATAIY